MIYDSLYFGISAQTLNHRR